MFCCRDSKVDPPPPPVNHVLSSNPALVNENIQITGVASPANGSPVLPAKKSAALLAKQSVAALRSSKPTAAPVVSRPGRHSVAFGSETIITPAPTKAPPMKPVSAGLLFGVKERELPAPDTVRETRKLFECNNNGGARSPRKLSGGGLTKSKSTSSLYTKPGSRSSSVEAAKSPARGSPARRRGGVINGSSPRRTSESMSSSTATMSAGLGGRPASFIENESVLRRSSNYPSKSR